jgi:DNA-binding NarL/FixJ family response regulator
LQSRILIVDDHPIFREGLKSLLNNEKDLKFCCEASSSEEALKQLRNCPCDLVTMDLSLSGGSGLQLIKQFRSYSKSIKILVASMHDETLFAERCIRAGATGYINKEEAPQYIINAIRVVLSGKLYLSDAMKEHLAQRNFLRGENTSHLPEEALSNREMEVFMLIGEGKSSHRIACQLNISSKTVDTHKEHIKKKLGIGDKAELIKKAVSWTMRDSLQHH